MLGKSPSHIDYTWSNSQIALPKTNETSTHFLSHFPLMARAATYPDQQCSCRFLPVSHSPLSTISKPLQAAISSSSGRNRYRTEWTSVCCSEVPVSRLTEINVYLTLTTLRFSWCSGSAIRIRLLVGVVMRFTRTCGRCVNTAGPYQKSNKNSPPGIKVARADLNTPNSPSLFV